MNAFIKTALQRDIVQSSLRVALVVGSILVAINYIDKILNGSLVTSDWLKITLTYCVPYLVSTYSAVRAKLN